METLLLIDRDKAFQERVVPHWQKQFVVICTDSIDGAFETLTTNKISVVLLELTFLNGNDTLIKRIKRDFDPHLPIIVLCESGNLDHAVAAIRGGAYDFTLKGLIPELLFEKIAAALRYKESEMRAHVLSTNLADRHDQLVFASDAMKKIHYEISRLAAQDFDVLLCGETGVGKDLLAFELHRRGSRENKPFITLPMRSLSETLIESELFGHEKGAYSGADSMKIGRLEAAHKGTLYIPEVSSLTESLQLKLLYFLQYKTITRVGQDPRKPEIPLNVRLVFASNKSMEHEVAKGHVREDFFYRISGVKVNIPPLRERPEDIEPLFHYFLKKYAPAQSTQHTIAPDLFGKLLRYRWPGNIRELENCVKHMLAMAADHHLKSADLPLSIDNESAGEECRVCLGTRFANLVEYAVAEGQFRRAYFSVLLEKTSHNIPTAAQKAGMTPQGLRKTVKSLNLDK